MRLPLLLSSLILSLVSLSLAQSTIDPAVIEQTVIQELRDTRTPGAAIGIVVDGKLAFARGFGTSNIETGAPVTPATLFRLGSTTKMLTATAVASLAAEGKLKFDDPVGKHVAGLDPAISRLTIEQILSHTSGLKDTAVMNGRHDDAALGEEIRDWKGDWLFTQPGRIYSYSNPGFWLAGYVAEVVGGAPYASIMEKRVFEPLGMDHTTLRPTMAMTRELSQGHDVSDAKAVYVLRPAPDNASNWPAGSVFSSVNDLAKFTIALMSGGLPAKVIEALTTPHADLPGSTAHYGFGLTLDQRDGQRIWSHGGSRAGYGSFITMLPDRHSAIIVLCNRTGENLPRTREKIASMLGLSTPVEPAVADRAIDATEFTHYTGLYRNGDSTINIALHKGKLTVDSIEVRLSNDGSLILRGPDGKVARRLIAVKDSTGRVEYLHAGGRSLARVAE